MAAFLGLVIFLISLAVPSFATVYTIGDAAGWASGVDYTSWTSGKTFTVGDSLKFNYGGGHTVDEVSASDYNSCTAGNSISSDSTGSTTIALNKPGTHYFICGAFGHCGNGMKLAVPVTAADAGATPSATPAPTGDGNGDGAPPSTAPTPLEGGGAPTTPSKDTGSPSVINSPTSKVPVEASSASGISAFAAVVSAWAAALLI
ncbi:blue copper protein-like [Momordica charantia]|uniref:Blue copper protein-like n=1 Tax=Momordica charantia TaxID=3673 RepID=A0A6J1BV33_MOMCH|nr:blue copper protein-like [Momordica charantia]